MPISRKGKKGSPGPNMAGKPRTLQRINHSMKAKDGHGSPATGARAVGQRSGDSLWLTAAAEMCCPTPLSPEQLFNTHFATAEEQVDLAKFY